MRYIKSFIGISYRKIMMFIFSIFPIVENRILFEAYQGEKYSCNPKYIYEKMYKENKDFEFIWVLNNKNIYSVNSVKKDSIKYFYFLATSKIWITNTHRLNYPKPREKTKYLIIWHGAGAFKKFGCNSNNINNNFIKAIKKDGDNYTNIIVSASNIIDIYSDALAIDRDKFKAFGLPRNDILINHTKEYKKSIKNKLVINENKKVILYAPTYRSNEKILDVVFDYNKFSNLFGDEFILLVKSHYYIKQSINDELYNDSIKVCSDYDDIQELLIISDILITDYSSVYYDFLLLERPIIFYSYDLDKYESDWGGFYIDYKNDLPGIIAYDFEELITIIKNREYENPIYLNNLYKAKIEAHEYIDGKSTERVIELINKYKEE